jgi:hypothetical protein
MGSLKAKWPWETRARDQANHIALIFFSSSTAPFYLCPLICQNPCVSLVLAKGWFRYDPATGRVVPAGEAATADVFVMRDLPGGAVLIVAEKGLFRFDPAAGRVVSADEATTGKVLAIHDLPGGAVPIAAGNGLFTSPALALDKANVKSATDFDRVIPSPNWQEVRFTFSHPCAPVSGNLALTMVPALNGGVRAPKDG